MTRNPSLIVAPPYVTEQPAARAGVPPPRGGISTSASGRRMADVRTLRRWAMAGKVVEEAVGLPAI
jgi:hypothetical protein